MQTTKTPRWQNIVGLLLALCMALTLLSVQALAAPGDEAEPDRSEERRVGKECRL